MDSERERQKRRLKRKVGKLQLTPHEWIDWICELNDTLAAAQILGWTPSTVEFYAEVLAILQRNQRS